MIINVKLGPHAYIAGSGVLISKRGAVLTADHVLYEKAKWIIAEDSTGRRAGCRVLLRNSYEDLAIIRCDGLAGLPYVRNVDRVGLGERVILIGSPGINQLLLNTGGVCARVDERLKILVDALIGGGMSGGPVFNHNGHLVGIIQAQLISPPFTAVTASYDTIKSMIHAVRNKV